LPLPLPLRVLVPVEPLPLVFEPLPVVFEPLPLVFEPLPVVFEPLPLVFEPLPVVFEPLPLPVIPEPVPVVPEPVPVPMVPELLLPGVPYASEPVAVPFMRVPLWSEADPDVLGSFAGRSELLLQAAETNPIATTSVEIFNLVIRYSFCSRHLSETLRLCTSRA
jgi:hypothetical protein